MSLYHQFAGKWGEVFRWDGVRTRSYSSTAAQNVTETWLIGKSEQARNFALRYYEVDAGGYTVREQHAHDHGLVFLHGSGSVLLGEEQQAVAPGDVVYIPPDTLHQIINQSDEKLGFLCIIPANRMRNGKSVWADEGLDLQESGS